MLGVIGRGANQIAVGRRSARLAPHHSPSLESFENQALFAAFTFAEKH